MKTTICVMIACMVLMGACSKKETAAPDLSAVSLQISSPEAGHIYHNGDSVRIIAEIGFNDVLHGYEINVTDTVTGEVLFDADEHEHQDSFHVNKTFVVSGSQATSLRVIVRTEVNHSGDIAEKQVLCTYQP